MTLIVNEQHKKLSKRDETIIQFIEQYEELGYLPEALFNFIAFLGWSPGGEREIFSREELIEIFDAETSFQISCRIRSEETIVDEQPIYEKAGS